MSSPEGTLFLVKEPEMTSGAKFLSWCGLMIFFFIVLIWYMKHARDSKTCMISEQLSRNRQHHHHHHKDKKMQKMP